MGFFKQEYWRLLPFPPPGDLPDPKIEHTSPASLALTSVFFITEPPEKPNRRIEVCVCVCVCVCTLYYLELVSQLESENFQLESDNCSQQTGEPEELTYSSWLSPKTGESGKPMVQILVQKLSVSTPKKSHCFSPNLNTRKDQCPSSYSQAAGDPFYSTFLFHLGLQLIGWGPLSLGRTICFTQSINSYFNLIQTNPHRPTQNNVYPNVWVLRVPDKLKHKINHHTVLQLFPLSPCEGSKGSICIEGKIREMYTLHDFRVLVEL